MSDRSKVQVSYDAGSGDQTVATIVRVFENGFKVLASFEGEDAAALIEAWNNRRDHDGESNLGADCCLWDGQR